jgi:hypothetical protein
MAGRFRIYWPRDRRTIKLTVTRLKCMNPQCLRRTFAGIVPDVTDRLARRTSRVTEIVRLVWGGDKPGHRSAGVVLVEAEEEQHAA